TVVAAFEQLVAEGYLESRVGDGTRVAAVLPETLLHARRTRVAAASHGTAPGLSRRGAAMVAARRPSPDPLRRAFQPGLPAVDVFPRDVWARLLGRRGRPPPPGHLRSAHAPPPPPPPRG